MVDSKGYYSFRLLRYVVSSFCFAWSKGNMA